jgi:hypothetical protein
MMSTKDFTVTNQVLGTPVHFRRIGANPKRYEYILTCKEHNCNSPFYDTAVDAKHNLSRPWNWCEGCFQALLKGDK